MTKFMINNRTDALKTDVNLLKWCGVVIPDAYLAPRIVIFDPSAFGFVVSNERNDSWDENASSLRYADLFLGVPRLPPEVVSARLNLSARGPKKLLLHGKIQAGRALYHWSACQNLGVPYPKWMSCKCALSGIRLRQFVDLRALLFLLATYWENGESKWRRLSRELYCDKVPSRSQMPVAYYHSVIRRLRRLYLWNKI